MILTILVVFLVLGGVSLVVLYNRIVNFNHNLGEAKAELSDLQSQNADIKDRLFTLLDLDGNSAVFGGHGLIEDKNPQYLEINSKWSYASGR